MEGRLAPKELNDLLSEKNLGETYIGTIVCSSTSSWVPDIESVDVSVSVDPKTKEITGSANLEVGSIESTACSATLVFKDHWSGTNVSRTFSLAGQTKYIEDAYSECILPNRAATWWDTKS